MGDTFDELNRIAPTVTVALRSRDWRARIVGLATGREAQAAAAIEHAEAAVVDAAARLDDLPGRRVAVISRNGGEIHRVLGSTRTPWSGHRRRSRDSGIRHCDQLRITGDIRGDPTGLVPASSGAPAERVCDSPSLLKGSGSG